MVDSAWTAAGVSSVQNPISAARWPINAARFGGQEGGKAPLPVKKPLHVLAWVNPYGLMVWYGQRIPTRGTVMADKNRKRRWPNGVRCVECASDRIHTCKPTARRKTPTYHGNDCKKDFTVKTGTIMHDSRLPLSKWALAFYLFSTHLKGVSSMKLHRDLGITQKSAWYMAHRIRETWDDSAEQFAGPVEADETYIGGKESNKHKSKRLKSGRGTVGKTQLSE